MGAIVSMFSWLWRGIKEMFAWLTSIPSILIGSIVGVVTAVSTLLGSLTSGGSVVTEAISTANSAIQTTSGILQDMPDIVKLGFYAVSLDVLYRFLFSAFFLFVSGVVAVLEFQLVTILTFYGVVFVHKMVAWFINAFFPASWRVSGVKSIAGASPVEVDFKEIL